MKAQKKSMMIFFWISSINRFDKDEIRPFFIYVKLAQIVASNRVNKKREGGEL